MTTLDVLGKRIDTVRDLAALVRTMKTLAAVSIRPYERAVDALDAYGRTVDLGLQALLRQSEFQLPDHEPPKGPNGIIVFGTDHGLCGRFNENVVAHALLFCSEIVAAEESMRIVAVGSRVGARLEEAGSPPEATLRCPGSAAGLGGLVERILLVIDGWRRAGIGRVTLFHNHTGDSGSIVPVERALLPLDTARLRDLARRPWRSRSLPTTTLDPELLLAQLIRQHLTTTLFRSAAQSSASEHAGRLASMQLAERNIQERLTGLEADFRRVRQEAITEELLEVVAGYEALRREPAARYGSTPEDRPFGSATGKHFST